MEITNSFTVDAPIDEAWELLTDIPEIAPCLPGAKLTDHIDGVYNGGIKIKVGPVTAEYKGSAEFVEKDAVARKVVINGKGRDTRGAGNAQALITANMEAVGNQTKVDIHTDLKVSGKVAQFGRGVMQDISTKLIGQFVECVEAKIAASAGAGAVATSAASAGAGAVAASAATQSSPPATTVTPPAEPATTFPAGLPSPPIMPESAISGDEQATTSPAPVAAAPAPAPTTPAASPTSSSSDDDDNVLDLGDIGLGSSIAKEYGTKVAGGAFAAFILALMFRRLRGGRSA